MNRSIGLSCLTIVFCISPITVTAQSTPLSVIVTTGDGDTQTIRPRPSVNNHGIVAFVAEYTNADFGLSDNIFMYNTNTGILTKAIKDFFTLRNSGSAPNQTLSFNVQINDHNEVMNRRFMNGIVLSPCSPIGGVQATAPLTYLEGFNPSQILPHQNPDGPLLRPVAYANGNGGVTPVDWAITCALNPVYFWNAILNPVPYEEQLLTSLGALSPFPAIQPQFSLNNNGAVVFLALEPDFTNQLRTVITRPRPGNGGSYSPGLLPPPETNNSDLNPVLADNGKVIFTERDAAGTWIRVFDYSLTLMGDFPALSGSFLNAGVRPGINDLGDIIVFYAQFVPAHVGSGGIKPGPGVFAGIARPDNDWEVFRVAGFHANRWLDPGELFDDLNGNGSFDPNANEIDRGHCVAFYPDLRLCANNNGIILFIADDLFGSKSVFLQRVDRESLIPSKCYALPMRLVGVNDFIPSIGRFVDDVSVHDSLGDNGRATLAAVWAKMDDGSEAILYNEFSSPDLRIDANNDGVVTLTGTPDDCSDPESDECLADKEGLSNGVLVRVNNNDSDEDLRRDHEDAIINGFTDEADLAELHLGIDDTLAALPGYLRLSVPHHEASKVRIFSSAGYQILGAPELDDIGEPIGEPTSEYYIPN